MTVHPRLHRLAVPLLTTLALGLPLAAAAQGAPKPAAAGPAAAACPALLQHSFARLQDDKPQSLCQYAGKVLLVVNTASYCGFTPQYEGLEALHAKYASRGLVVLGFPSNDFFQESKDSQKIADLCFNTYGVKFPMFASMAVRGSDAHPFYVALAQATGEKPSWNFNKYLVDRQGRTLAHYGSRVEPTGRELTAAIEKALGTP